MAENDKPDFAPKEYKMPKLDFSDTDVGKQQAAKTEEKTYTVDSGDSLWKIAKEQLGDTSTVPAIKELNKQSVKNWDVLPAGTKLRMPARPLASIQ